MKHANFIILALISICLVQIACTKQENTTVNKSDIEAYLLNDSLNHGFRVDSIVFDKSSTTPKRNSTHYWNLEQQGSNLNRFKTEIVNTKGETVGGMIFTSENIENKLVYTFNGISYINLVWPRQTNTVWNPLIYDNEDRTIYVSGEPLKIHLSWEGKVVEETTYTFNNGITVDAIKVELANYEDKLKVRRVSETYAKGYGLVERNILIANTQDITSTEPWETKAESGFIATIKSTR